MNDTRKKVMISQPMAGKTNEQIREERRAVVAALEGLGYEVLDTVLDISCPPEKNPGVYYLAKSIEHMSRADAVLFMRGWALARGCRIEHEIAAAYGLEVVDVAYAETTPEDMEASVAKGLRQAAQPVVQPLFRTAVD